MSERKRHTEDDGFLGSHFSSGGKLGLGRGDAIRGARSPEALKQAVLSILQEGETVTRALKRLRPPPKQAGANKKRRLIGGKQRQVQDAKAAADNFFSELEGPDTEAQEREAENKRQFETLTEAAGELLDLGFEDIYQDSRETIAASLQGGAAADQNRRTFIWHDDGLTAPKRHDALDDVTSFKDLPRAPDLRQDSQQQAASSGRRSTAEGAAAAAAGAVQYNTAVPHTHAPSSQASGGAAAAGRATSTSRADVVTQPPAVPKLAPLPPPPPGLCPPAAPSGQQQPAPAVPPTASSGYQQPYAPPPQPYPPAYDASHYQQQQWHAQQQQQGYAGMYPPAAGPLQQGWPQHPYYPAQSPAGGWPMPPQANAQYPGQQSAHPPGQPHWGSMQQGPAG